MTEHTDTTDPQDMQGDAPPLSPASPDPDEGPQTPGRSWFTYPDWLPLDRLSIRTGVYLCAGLMLLSALLSAYRIGSKEVWLDESNAIIISQQPIPELFERLALDSSPPLHYLVLHYWMAVFGSSEAATRSLSAVGFVLLVGAVFWFGWSMFSSEIGVYAGALMAVYGGMVDRAQQVRPYTLLPLAALVSVYLLWRALQRPGWRRTLAYAGTTLLCLYLHNISFFLLPAHGVIFLCCRGWRVPVRQIAVALGVLVIGYLPWVPFVTVQMQRSGYLYWVRDMWDRMGTDGAIWHTILTFVGLSDWGRLGAFWKFDTHLILVFGTLAMLFGLVAWSFIRKRGRRRIDSPDATILIYLFVTLGGALLTSVFVSKNPFYIPGRVDQVALPGFMLALAIGVRHIPIPLVRVLLLILMLIHSGYWLYQLHLSKPHPDNARRAAAAIAKSTGPKDVVVFTGLSRATLQYYLEQKRVRVKLRSFPHEQARHLGNHDPAALRRRAGALRTEATKLVQELSQSAAQRVLLVIPNQAKRFRASMILFRALARSTELRFEFRRGPYNGRLGQYHIYVFRVP